MSLSVETWNCLIEKPSSPGPHENEGTDELLSLSELPELLLLPFVAVPVMHFSYIAISMDVCKQSGCMTYATLAQTATFEIVTARETREVHAIIGRE